MRKRLFLGNAILAVLAGVLVFVLSRSGSDAATAGLTGIGVFFVLASIHGTRVINGLLSRLDGIEEAAFRAAMGESNVRLGAVEPPYDGLASRLDRLFERLDESAAEPEGTESSGPNVA